MQMYVRAAHSGSLKSHTEVILGQSLEDIVQSLEDIKQSLEDIVQSLEDTRQSWGEYFAHRAARVCLACFDGLTGV